MEQASPSACWGRNAVLALLKDAPQRCAKLVFADTARGGWVVEMQELCREHRIVYQFADTAALDRMTDGERHQGVAAVVSEQPMIDLEEFLGTWRPGERELAVVLDHVQDPHNVGAVLRSAEAAGATFAVIPRRRSALPVGIVAKTSSGASLRIPILLCGNVAQAVRALQEAGFWVVALEEDAGTSLYDGELPDRLALVSGGEDGGVGRTVLDACDEARAIPMRGRTGSLNTSVAASVAMFEWVRQRGQK